MHFVLFIVLVVLCVVLIKRKSAKNFRTEIEEEINVEGRLLRYSFSSNLKDIEKAVFARTGKNVELANVGWLENTQIPQYVIDMMNARGVDYCMTTYVEGDERVIDINRKSQGNWFTYGIRESETELQSKSKATDIGLKVAAGAAGLGVLKGVGDGLKDITDYGWKQGGGAANHIDYSGGRHSKDNGGNVGVTTPSSGISFGQCGLGIGCSGRGGTFGTCGIGLNCGGGGGTFGKCGIGLNCGGGS